jgi:hypothetical protein
MDEYGGGRVPELLPLCATNEELEVFDAVMKMGVGPPESPFRGRLQTAHCCCVQKAWW